MSALQKEIDKRKTFAIISHPDAGKTTLTEKLLLFGGAIQVAGAVKNNKIKKTAASDFMEIEKQRGISVATSVMTFEYKGKLVNILDTPGHKDFAEDTYRTLSAVDSVILVIDAASGVESQTEKLMEVCRMRDTPVLIFVNKLDREGHDPFILMDELEEKLSIKVKPMTWPIGMGQRFKGVYNLPEKGVNLFEADKQRISKDIIAIKDLSSSRLNEIIGDAAADQLREDIELVEGVYDDFDKHEYESARVAPVFFGSALNNFGVQELLDAFVNIAPEPQPRTTDHGEVKPDDEKFSGFIFKIHANIDPRHRDRIAFLRVCSGRFERNTFYRHVRQGKKIKFSNPYSFMARSKEVVDDAYAGDVIGLYDTGNFKIGDTLTEGEDFSYKGVPVFSPEIFREVINKDPLKTKQLDKGVRQLTEEGVAQMFTQQPGNIKIVGTVGELQFEVIKHRLENEYGASCEFRPKPFYKAVWLTTDNEAKLKEFMRIKGRNVGYDKDDRPVFLAESKFLLETAVRDYPEIEFHTNTEFKTDAQTV